MASEYGEIRHMPDSGLMCLAVVSERYSPDLTDTEKRYCVQADNKLAYVLAMTYSDYAGAFSYLRKAMDICSELADTSAMTLYNTGIIYHAAELPTANPEFFDVASASYLKALEKSVSDKEYEIANSVIPNLMELYCGRPQADSISNVVASYGERIPRDDSFLVKYNKLLLSGLAAMRSGDYIEAGRIFASQLELTEGADCLVRFRLNTMLNLAKAKLSAGEGPDAVSTALEAADIAKRLDCKDCLTEFYRFLYEYYGGTNDVSRMQEYFYEYSRIRDDIFSSMVLSNLSSQKFIDELSVTRQELRVSAERNHWQKIVLWVTSAFLVLAFAACVVIWRMNRRLRKDNNLLYDNNLRLMEVESEAQRERKSLEREIEELKTVPAPSVTSVDVREPEGVSETGLRNTSKKRFPLDEADSRAMFKRFKELLEDMSMVCDSGASLETFATRIGTKPRYLSHVIGEESGRTFPQLLNESRIKEACRRINRISEYGHLTIEAIAESVGFKSRSHFAAVFAKYTGMRPSTYQRIARERNAQ